MTGPKFVGTDLPLGKTFQINERSGLRIIASGFNIFNHPNFQNPDNNIAGTATFGQSLSDIAPDNSSTGARVFQFAARLEF